MPMKFVCSTLTFKLSYTPLHTRLFLDQAHNSTINGFTPNANTPDPNWGICLQCAAIDRARYRITPIPSRSAICSQCFTQYCYDPQNPPSVSELPGRKFQFVDPQPEGLDQLADFFDYTKYKLVGGLVGLIILIVILIFGLCVLLRLAFCCELTDRLFGVVDCGGRSGRRSEWSMIELLTFMMTTCRGQDTLTRLVPCRTSCPSIMVVSHRHLEAFFFTLLLFAIIYCYHTYPPRTHLYLYHLQGIT
jgi:hypothetical protein